MPVLDQSDQEHLQGLLARGTTRRQDIFQFVQDVQVLAKAGYGMLCADHPKNAIFGIVAFKGDTPLGAAEATVQIEVSDYRASILGRDDPAARVIESDFRTAEGRRIWLKAVQEQARAVVEEASVIPRTCWERLLAND